MRHSHLAALCLIMAGSSLSAGGKPAGGTNPQIAYVRTSTGGGYQLTVANEDGSGAQTIYSSARMLNGELGPDGNIYFWEGGNFKRMPSTGGTPEALFATPGTVSRHSDLSRDGRNLAWYSPEAGALFVYDIGGQQHLLTSTALLLDVTYDYTSTFIYYVEEMGGGASYEVKRISATGGDPESFGLVGGYGSVDSAHRDGTLILTNWVQGVPSLEVWKPGMSAPTRIDRGYNGTYRCDDSAILYTLKLNAGPALYRRASSGAVTQVAKPSSVFPSYKPLC